LSASDSDVGEQPIAGTAERLKREKKYGDALLFSWGMVEQEVDSMLSQKLGYGENKLENTPFKDKINALVEAKCLNQDDARKIFHFKQKRDAIFHDYTNTMMWASGDAPKDELADIAIEGLKASTNSFIGCLKPIRQTSEIRQYFLSFKTVERNAFRDKISQK